jgi:hypothetical protein
MLDNLHNDLQAFADQSMQKIEQRFGTWEKESESRMLDQCRSIVSSQHRTNDANVQEFHQERFKELTLEMHNCFMRSEELSATKMFTMQQEVLKQLMKMETRLDDLESHAVKDRTLASNQALAIHNRCQLLEEDHSLTKLQLAQHQVDWSSQNLHSTDQLGMTLGATINERFELLEQSLRNATIQRMDTYLGNKLLPLLTSNQEMLIQFREDRLKMMSIIKDKEDKEAELINQVMTAQSSVTNLEETVTSLNLKLQELKEQSASKKEVRMDEQLVTTNAPTGVAPLINSCSSLYLPFGAVQQADWWRP